MLGLFLIRCVFTKKTEMQKSDSENLLKPERIEAFRNTVQCWKYQLLLIALGQKNVCASTCSNNQEKHITDPITKIGVAHTYRLILRKYMLTL